MREKGGVKRREGLGEIKMIGAYVNCREVGLLY